MQNDTSSPQYVSIVLPAYNCETTIADAVHSVMAQTYPYFELLIINDASTDKTAVVLDSLQKQYPTITLINNTENLGVSESRNRGVEVASYSWIAFLDSDDLWYPEKLAQQMLVARSGIADLVYTSYTVTNFSNNKNSYIFHVPETMTYKELLKQNVISCSGVLLKKDLLLRHRMMNDSIHEDYFTWLRILKDGSVARGIDEPLHTVRILNKASKSGRKSVSARMTYNTYRALGLSPVSAFYYFMHYAFRSIRKYSDIRKGFTHEK